MYFYLNAVDTIPLCHLQLIKHVDLKSYETNEELCNIVSDAFQCYNMLFNIFDIRLHTTFTQDF